MRLTALLAAAALSSTAAAQVTVYGRGGAAGPAIARAFGTESARAVIGITTTGGATSRDTLGVLVSSVRANSPAEKAGIEEGNRIASINGVSLKLAAVDVGEFEMAGAMSRRLTRELNKLKPGDEVDLRVYTNGQSKSLKVKTVSPDSLYMTNVVRRDSDRATLGVNVAVTGTSRDTIGIFVMSVEDNGPAAKAGIEEGARIASVNGVDVRARRNTDEDDLLFRAGNVNRLEREMSKVKPGETVDLRVYYNGQFKNVKVTAARASDLPRRNRSITIMGGDNFITPPLPPLPDRITLDAPRMGEEIRRAIDGARIMGGGFGNRVIW